MGAVTTAITALTGQSDAAAKQVAGQLEMLMALATAKQQQQAALIDDRIARAKENKEIPPAVKMFERSEVRVVSSTGPAAGITDAVNGLLQNAQENWKSAVGGLVGVALNTLLGQAAGSSQDTALYIVALDGKPASPENPNNSLSPIRIDYCLWAYNVSDSSIKDTVSAAVAYTARKYIVDLHALPDILTLRFVLQSIGTPADMVDQWIDAVEELKKQPEPIREYVRQELEGADAEDVVAELGL